MTTTFTGGATFTSPAGFLPISITIPASRTLHEVHGNVTLSVPGAGVNGSIIVELLADGGNVVAAAKLQKFGKGSVSVPISATFPTPLAASQFQWRFYVDLAGQQGINMALVMN